MINLRIRVHVAAGIVLGCLAPICQAEFGEPMPLPTNVTPDQLSRPYKARSLKGMSLEQIIEWMGEGKSGDDFVVEQRRKADPAPLNPWDGTVEEAVRSRVERERALSLLKNDPLRIESSHVPIPDAGLVTFQVKSAGCFGVGGTTVIQLRWHPERSWVVVADDGWPDLEGGSAFSRRLSSVEFHFSELRPADARRVAELLLALGRCSTAMRGPPPKSIEENGDQIVVTSGYSAGELAVSGDSAGTLLRFRAEMVRGCTDFRQEMGWSEEFALRVASGWLSSDVPLRVFGTHSPQLGRRRAEVNWPSIEVLLLDSLPPEEIERVHRSAASVLAIALESPGLMDASVVSNAVGASGEFGFVELQSAIERLTDQMPGLSDWELRAKELREKYQEKKAALLARSEGGLAEYVERFGFWPTQEFSKDESEAQKPFSRETRELIREIRDLQVRRYNHNPFYGMRPDAVAGSHVAELRRALELSMRQLAERDDAGALEDWIQSKEPGAAWAYRRLAVVDPTAATQLLARELDRRLETNEGVPWALRELELKSPALAKKLISGLPEAKQGRLWHPQYPNPVNPSSATVTELLATMQDVAADDWDRRQAVTELVPPANPMRHTEAEIELVLRKLWRAEIDSLVLQTRALRSGNEHRVLFGEVCRALSVRDPVANFSFAAEAVLALGKFNYFDERDEVLQYMTEAVRMDPEQLLPKFTDLLSTQLTDSESTFMPLKLVWEFDLRGLRELVAKRANSGPDDYEASARQFAKPLSTPLRGHLARQIATIWDEPDPATRIPLLAAFGLHAGTYWGVQDAALRRLESDLRCAYAELPPEQREPAKRSVGQVIHRMRPEGNPETSSEVIRVLQRAIFGDDPVMTTR